jgi:hypothetical protein
MLYLLAKTFGGRPSAYVGVGDQWAAYQFDMAVMFAGLDPDDSGDAPEGGDEPVSYDWSDLAE